MSAAEYCVCSQPATVDGLCDYCHLDVEQDREVDRVPDSEQDVDVNYYVEQNQENGRGLSLGVTSRLIDEFAELRAAYHAGTLSPVLVEVRIPAHFGPKLREISDDMELLYGLRLAEGETRSLPYPTTAPVAIGLARDKREASRHLRRLVNAGVWVDAEPLSRFKAGGQLLDGTKCYLPGGEA
jgi:hypothetical protein